MKVLIWFGCFFVMALVQTVLKGGGIGLGFVPTFLLYFITFFIAKKLCNVYDEHGSAKKEPKGATKKVKAIAESGMSTEEYIKANVPQSYLEVCERYRGKRIALESYLFPLVKNKSISKETYIILLDKYGVPNSCLEACERYRGNPIALESYLLPLVKNNSISEINYKNLLEEYSKDNVKSDKYTEDELHTLFHKACDSFNSTSPEERKFFEEVRGSEELRLAWLDDKRRKKEAYDEGIRYSFKKTYLDFIKFLAEDYSEK